MKRLFFPCSKGTWVLLSTREFKYFFPENQKLSVYLEIQANKILKNLWFMETGTDVRSFKQLLFSFIII